jgi:rhodanese-related sulfurtransferase
MHQKPYSLFALLIILSMILGACASPTAAPVVEPQAPAAPVVQPTQPPAPTKAPEPTPVPPTPTPEPVVYDWESMFAAVIEGMDPEKAFGSVKVSSFNEELTSKAPFILDVREAGEIEKEGYIDGAVHIPVRQVMTSLDMLPGVNDPIVVYCGSGHRGAFVYAALKMLGYTNVRNLNGGLNAWKKAEFPVVMGTPAAAQVVTAAPAVDADLVAVLDEFFSTLPDNFYAKKADAVAEDLASGKAPYLLDVRTQGELDRDGYIDGSVHIPLHQVFARLGELPASDAPMVVYCASGHRAGVVVMYLRMAGYTGAINMLGGSAAWKNAKLPMAGVVDWKTAWTDYFAAMPENFYAIKADALNTALVETPPFLLDVREASEIEQNGYIEGSVHIPFRDVLKNLDKLPALDQPVVVLCASGHRGAMVMSALQFLGYKDVKNLAGGIGAWKKAEFPVVQDTPAAAEAGIAPAVDPIVLRDLEAFFAALPDGFAAVKAADLNAELAGTAPFIVDTRTAKEVENGMIEGSVHIPIHDLFKELAQLPADKAAPIVLVCQSGHRGAIGLMALRMNGYTSVRNLGGGMNAWAAAELPVVTR